MNVTDSTLNAKKKRNVTRCYSFNAQNKCPCVLSWLERTAPEKALRFERKSTQIPAPSGAITVPNADICQKSNEIVQQNYIFMDLDSIHLLNETTENPDIM